MSSKPFKKLAEIQNFVENAWNKTPIETFENAIKGMSNWYARVIALGGKNIRK